MSGAGAAPAFRSAAEDFPYVAKAKVETLQFNLGRLCNQACRHCHVDSSPARSGPADNASGRLIDEVLELLRREPGLRLLDLTGGAPELNPHFRRLVAGARELGRTVYVRHNLTVQDEPGQDDLPKWFAAQGVELFCSLPCYLEENVDAQRGDGVFARSIAALRRLNAAGYGRGDGRVLNLVYNPLGPSLPPPQGALETDYRRRLGEHYGIVFDRLVTITNQPIHRFRQALERRGELGGYLRLLKDSFNKATLAGLMCRTAVSLRWDGRLFDCDFNLVQDLPLIGPAGRPLTLSELLADPTGLALFDELPVTVDQHCFACTAGYGSSCGGALAADDDGAAATADEVPGHRLACGPNFEV
ncbi:MAG: radical SAM/Cys-rich domain protein [Planctomycetota bacterium]|nr:MAG: radical SAM/Cys-rich domain protein [Planctomycetota bacterium]